MVFSTPSGSEADQPSNADYRSGRIPPSHAGCPRGDPVRSGTDAESHVAWERRLILRNGRFANQSLKSRITEKTNFNHPIPLVVLT